MKISGMPSGTAMNAHEEQRAGDVADFGVGARRPAFVFGGGRISSACKPANITAIASIVSTK